MATANSLKMLNKLHKALLGTGRLEEKLKKITDGVVEIFNADFSRIWVAKSGDLCNCGCIHARVVEKKNICRFRERCLHLMASSGRYTHVHGPHSRMPFGLYKLGRVATGKVNKFLTNDILNDPQIMNHKWARELGLASFAGYKLQDSSGEPIGVLALFSKQPITPEESSLIEGLSDTTAQVIQSEKQEEVLKLERDRTMSILGSMGDGVFIINQDCDIEYTNPVIEKDFGLANGSKCYRYFHDRNEICPWCNNSKVFAGKTVQCEWQSHKSNKTYELIGTPLRTLDGRISKLEIARDITDRKRTEEALRKHEQHLESINQIGLLASKSLDLDEVLQCVLDGVLKASGAPTGMIFIKDPNDGSLNLGVSKGLSDALVKEFSKYPYQDGECLVGRIFVTSKSIYIRENTSCDPRINRSVVKEGKLNSFIGVPVFSEDEVVAVIIILTQPPEVLEKVGIVLVEAVASHVSSAIRNARFYTGLKKAEEKYRSLYENSLDGIYRSDQNGNFIDANPAMIKMLGFRDKADLLSVKAKDLYFSELAWEEALEKRKIFSGCVRRKDGSEIWLESTTQTIRDEQENIVYYEGIVRNISERKRTEEALRNAQKLESLGVLAGGIAHDFNNLLVSILGNADIALDELSPSSPARQYIQDVMSGAKRAADLAMQMLAYSGRGEFLLQPVDLSKLVEEITHLLEVSISKTCVLKYHFSPQIPAIKADASQIRQVVMNFVINASEAIGERSGVISITTGAMDVDSNYLKETYLDDDLANGCYVYIEVSDTGCGMNEETRVKIFDPFFTTKFTGRGLGLAAALGIIRSHNGALKVYSEPGQGTTFKVLFPVCDAPAVATQLPSQKADRWTGSGVVLIVDDEETVRSVAKRMLVKTGFTVIAACDGQEGVEKFKERAGEITLVLLDMTMPRLNGEETFRELRLIRPDIRVILMSGYNEQEATNCFAGKGLAGFLQKPFLRDELLERVIAVSEKNNSEPQT